MTQKQKKAIEILNKVSFSNDYKINNEDYFIILELILGEDFNSFNIPPVHKPFNYYKDASNRLEQVSDIITK